MKIKKIEYAIRQDTVFDFETPSHTYILGNGIISHNTQEMFSKTVMSGGTGIYYSSSAVWIVGRQQDKTGQDITGYHFIINIEKSRYVKEKSKIPISISWENGIEKYSGLLDVAKELGFVKSEKVGWFFAFDPATQTALTGNLRASATMNKEFWEDIIFSRTDFKNAVKKHYTISLKDLLASDKVIVQPEEDIEDELARNH